MAVPEGVVSAVGGISGSVQSRACREWNAEWRSQDSVLVKNFLYPNGLHCLSIYGKYFQLWFHGELNPFMGTSGRFSDIK